MRLCPSHLDLLKDALFLQFLDSRKDLEPLHQAITLINLNAVEVNPNLMGAPAALCPICYLRKEAWISEAAQSIAHYRKGLSNEAKN